MYCICSHYCVAHVDWDDRRAVRTCSRMIEGLHAREAYVLILLRFSSCSESAEMPTLFVWKKMYFSSTRQKNMDKLPTPFPSLSPNIIQCRMSILHWKGVMNVFEALSPHLWDSFPRKESACLYYFSGFCTTWKITKKSVNTVCLPWSPSTHANPICGECCFVLAVGANLFLPTFAWYVHTSLEVCCSFAKLYANTHNRAGKPWTFCLEWQTDFCSPLPSQLYSKWLAPHLVTYSRNGIWPPLV